MKILRHWHKWLDAFCLHSCTYNSLSFTGIVNCYHYFEQICNSDLNLSSSVQMTSLMTTWAIFFCFILTCYLYLYKKVFHFIYNYLGTKSLLFIYLRSSSFRNKQRERKIERKRERERERERVAFIIRNRGNKLRYSRSGWKTEQGRKTFFKHFWLTSFLI